jgi:hypothetical protein
VVRDGGAEAVRGESEARGMVFVDARETPFRLCTCGAALDFTSGDVAAGIM